MVRVGKWLGLWLCGGLAVVNHACIGQSCTLIGCSDSANVEIERAGAWQEGEYTLELALDGEQHSCSFVVPDDLPADGAGAPLDCGEGVDAVVWQRSMCSSIVSQDGNSGSGVCTPIPGEHQIALELNGNPKTIEI